MNNIKKRYTKKDVIKTSLITTLLFVLVTVLNVLIYKTDPLEIKYDKIITNNISFNNSNTTDMLKISNLKKMSDDKGISFKNKSNIEFEISGDKGSEYQIVLYRVGNIIEDEYIKYELIDIDNLDNNINTLNNIKETSDGGKIIFEGKIDKKKSFRIKMWIDKLYKEDVKNTSYEIKIKSK